MKKAMIGLTAAATLAVATIALPSSANAGCRGCAPAIIGGFVAGAVIGNAIANSPRYYYEEPAPVFAEPECFYRRERVWDEERGVWRRVRMRVCP